MLSPIAADHVQNPRRQGPLEGEDVQYGVSGSPGDGPYVEIWTRIHDGIIAQAAYRTHGCPSSVAASSMTCQLAEGKPLTFPDLLTAEDLILVLGGLPEGKERFARMAVEALRKSVEKKS